VAGRTLTIAGLRIPEEQPIMTNDKSAEANGVYAERYEHLSIFSGLANMFVDLNASLTTRKN
jgi:hypothetical protein